jgi:hypothetical protein
VAPSVKRRDRIASKWAAFAEIGARRSCGGELPLKTKPRRAKRHQIGMSEPPISGTGIQFCAEPWSRLPIAPRPPVVCKRRSTDPMPQVGGGQVFQGTGGGRLLRKPTSCPNDGLDIAIAGRVEKEISSIASVALMLSMMTRRS